MRKHEEFSGFHVGVAPLETPESSRSGRVESISSLFQGGVTVPGISLPTTYPMCIIFRDMP